MTQSGPAEVKASSTSSTQPVPLQEPRSRYGNGPVYEVYGKRYEVLDSSLGYYERGVASWYGRKFHGRLTSSREPYDMFEMTAAHKSLPLPTYVEVRNLVNNRSIVVRVNDRGPFVKNRLIDLSYSAALKLDIVESGTGMVEVRALTSDQARLHGQIAALRAVAQPTPGTTVSDTISDTVGETVGDPIDNTVDQPKIYVQVGASGDESNAERRHALLSRHGIESAFVQRDTAGLSALFRVRIGPLADVSHYDRIVSELSGIGIDDSHLIAE